MGKLCVMFDMSALLGQRFTFPMLRLYTGKMKEGDSKNSEHTGDSFLVKARCKRKLLRNTLKTM